MLKKDEAVEKEAKLQVLRVHFSLPGPAAIPWCWGGLWPPPSALAKHCKANHSSREGVHMETGQGTEQEKTLFSWACLVHVLQCQVQRSELLLSFRHIHCPHPPQPQLPGNLVSKIYTIFANGTRLTPNFVFKPRVSIMHVAGEKRHCFTVLILNESAQSERKAKK